MNEIQTQLMMDQSHQSYAVWPAHPPPENPHLFFPSSQRLPFSAPAKHVRPNWKPKNPNLTDPQYHNRLKPRRFYPNRKKFNNSNISNRFAPFAPRNTTSYIIRAKKSGGITSLVSPCPVTPAILPTPIFSPSREVLVDMAKEEWGVDGYGSMKGLIRLRSSSPRDEDGDSSGDSDSDVEEHVEVERRLDHDLSRFEMIYPSGSSGDEQSCNFLESRVDDQGTHIARLEEENLTLKERLYLMERELVDLRRRVQWLEMDSSRALGGGDASDNEGGGGGGYVCSEKSVGDGDGD